MVESQPIAFNNTVTKQKVERNTYTSGDKSSLSALIPPVTINTGAHGRSPLPPGQLEGGRNPVQDLTVTGCKLNAKLKRNAK